MRVKADITLEEVESIFSLERAIADTVCACGDESGIAGICTDCFNVGCEVGKPCFWVTDPNDPKPDDRCH